MWSCCSFWALVWSSCKQVQLPGHVFLESCLCYRSNHFMLGRIAESASRGHSFRHNALMKWSTKKTPNNKKLPPPTKTPVQTKTKPKAHFLKTRTAVDWNWGVRGNSLLQTFLASNNLIESKLIEEHQTGFVTRISACWGGADREFASQMPYCSKGEHEYSCSLRVRFL